MFMVIALIFLLMHFALLESPQRNLILRYRCTVWATMCMPCLAWIECLRYPYTLLTFPLSNFSSVEKNYIMENQILYGMHHLCWVVCCFGKTLLQQLSFTTTHSFYKMLHKISWCYVSLEILDHEDCARSPGI